VTERTERDAALLTAATQHGGYLTWRHLVGTGLTRGSIEASLRDGALERRSYDLYAVSELSDADLWRDRVRRAVVEIGPAAVVGRATAARWQGIVGAPAVAPIDIVLPLSSRDPRLPGIDVTRAELATNDTIEVDGLAVTAPLRTVLDCARHGDQATAVCLLESAARQELITIAEVTARVEKMRRTPGVRRLRSALALVDLRSESPLETIVRIALLDGGLPYPEVQLPFRCGDVCGRIDLAYPSAMLGAPAGGRYSGLAIEVDGLEWHTQADTFHHDRIRQTVLEENNWLVRRFTDRSARSPSYIVETTRRAIARVVAG
jgi:hypothetical protein